MRKIGTRNTQNFELLEGHWSPEPLPGPVSVAFPAITLNESF